MKIIKTIILILAVSLGNSIVANAQTNNAYGDNQVEVEPGVFAIYSGDINQDQNIDINDQPQLDSDISNFAFGYLPTDINGDGNVDINDQPIVALNISNFVYVVRP